ncbi:MAG: four helix bundle protein [Ignavibacteria bacterium RIFOXYB2_FULL_35_12]|nr:MAG: four helix bundle protein [Ignavibacteria bacterium GWF2_35_20]OGU79210.1 MAG: four helix bundle protein [Ignavibacteria bacterium RIFOXYA2_FULL_35_9]OGU85781.1 MAG: four helix bundle protein [Ignavibacteria bacterium RIFOXYA12_FULL_35_25]OGU93154.1 MAG: four helix bundle protein [Ignavibacteria bacterium RIFOXYB12_FULL_35_14]OGU98309.1 MAG: four helix bundle protein [Ignavibacteria bacterium RIFOXYC2_FULL_35_16]OGV03407.1 MAG: four helix bundle protein [Ignavibacteria bacterium RIFOXY
MNCTIPPPEVLKFLPSLPKTAEFSVIRYQLAKSSTSAGANYEESQSGSSRADFLNKVRISLREMRESNYWLRIISTIQNDNKLVDQLTFLIQESEELKNILGAIVSKSNK